MKRNFFRLICATFALAAAFACSEDPATPETPDNGDGNGDTGGNGGTTTYTLIASPLSLNFNWSNPAPQSITVTTNAPEGFEIGATPDWFTATKSSNKVVVTPQSNEGEKRTYELEIKANGAASVKILISQDPKGEIHNSLKGSKYIVWHIDATSADFLGSKIVQQLSPDNVNRNLFVWPDGTSFVGEEGTGPNFYGNMDGYMCFSVSNIGWSGAGYTAPIADFAALNECVETPEGWYFHVAVKGTKGQGDAITLWSEDETKNYKINWDTYLGDDPNEWCEIEIPMGDIVATGWRPKSTGEAANGLSFEAGSKAGNKISFDAMFVYKK